MKYLFEERDRISKLFVRYRNAKDLSTFNLEVFVDTKEGNRVVFTMRDVLNKYSELFLIPGFLSAYRHLRGAIKEGTPIDTFLNKFEEDLEPDERLILELGEE